MQSEPRGELRFLLWWVAINEFAAKEVSTQSKVAEQKKAAG